ncbi:MAG: Lrp/AsnC ligand binding domain-containing protein [Bacteroidota bacterium]
MKTYIPINVRAGRTKNVMKKVSTIEGIKTAYTCWGRPDIFAYAEVKDDKALANVVLTQIHAVDGVQETDTHIVVEE